MAIFLQREHLFHEQFPYSTYLEVFAIQKLKVRPWQSSQDGTPRDSNPVDADGNYAHLAEVAVECSQSWRLSQPEGWAAMRPGSFPPGGHKREPGYGRCGSKYVELGSGSKILAQFGSRSRVRVILLMLSTLKKKYLKIIFEKNNTVFLKKKIFF